MSLTVSSHRLISDYSPCRARVVAKSCHLTSVNKQSDYCFEWRCLYIAAQLENVQCSVQPVCHVLFNLATVQHGDKPENQQK